MYWAQHTTASYSEIGRYFGGRNHSTVISAEKRSPAGSATSNATACSPASRPSPMSWRPSRPPSAPESWREPRRRLPQSREARKRSGRRAVPALGLPRIRNVSGAPASSPCSDLCDFAALRESSFSPPAAGVAPGFSIFARHRGEQARFGRDVLVSPRRNTIGGLWRDPPVDGRSKTSSAQRSGSVWWRWRWR